MSIWVYMSYNRRFNTSTKLEEKFAFKKGNPDEGATTVVLLFVRNLAVK